MTPALRELLVVALFIGPPNLTTGRGANHGRAPMRRPYHYRCPNPDRRRAFGAIAAEPFAGLAWVHLDTASFTEIGGVSALAGSGNRNDVGYSTLGARVATYYLLQNGMALIPRASVAWQHAFGDVTPTAALSFQSIGAGFNILGVPIARDAALVEAGGDLQLTAQAKIGVSYAGQLANSAHDHSVKGNFTWRF
jgi:outer membrane autotransporter protein